MGESLDTRDTKIAELKSRNAALRRRCLYGAIASLVLIVGAYFLGKGKANTAALAMVQGEPQAQRAPTWREQEPNLYEEPTP